MAARLNPRHQDMVREKIRASQLVRKLENHVLGNGKKAVEMSATQVQAALGLLKKCVPDLASTEMSVSGVLGQYEATRIPVELRHSDSLASTARPAIGSDPK